MSENTSFEPILTSREKRELCGEVFSRRKFVSVDLAGARTCRPRVSRRSYSSAATWRAPTCGGGRFIRSELREVLMTNATLGDTRFDGTSLRGVLGHSEERGLTIVRQGGLVQPRRASLR